MCQRCQLATTRVHLISVSKLQASKLRFSRGANKQGVDEKFILGVGALRKDVFRQIRVRGKFAPTSDCHTIFVSVGKHRTRSLFALGLDYRQEF